MGTCIARDLMANDGSIIVIWSRKKIIAHASQPLKMTTRRAVVQFDLPWANIKSINYFDPDTISSFGHSQKEGCAI